MNDAAMLVILFFAATASVSASTAAELLNDLEDSRFTSHGTRPHTVQDSAETETKRRGSDDTGSLDFLFRYLVDTNREYLLKKLLKHLETEERRNQIISYIQQSLETTLDGQQDKRADSYWQSMGGPLPVEPSLSNTRFMFNPNGFRSNANVKMMRFGRSTKS